MAYNVYAEHVEKIGHSLAFAAQDFYPFQRKDTPPHLSELARLAHAKVLDAAGKVADLEEAVDEYVQSLKSQR